MVSKTKAMEQLTHKMKKIVRTGGPDPKFNKDLAQLQLEYRAANFSDETFQRVLKNVQQQPLKAAQINLRGPSGSIFIIESEGLSKRKLQDFIATLVEKAGGGFQLSQKDYSRAFEDKGVVVVGATKGDKTLSLDTMEEVCIELDCDDVSSFEEDGQICYELVCSRNKFTHLTNTLAERGFNIKSSALELRAVEPVEITEDDSEKIRQLYEILRENDKITQVYDNVRPDSTSLRPVKMKTAS